jgi:BMFP domain-containing protein YqiC
MQSQNPFLDEMSKLTQAAMGLAQAAGEEAKSAFRSQTDKWVADMDLIRRDEYEALKARIEALEARIDALTSPTKS